MTPSKVTSLLTPLMVKSGYLRWVARPPSSVCSWLPTTMESQGEQPSSLPPASGDTICLISSVYSISPRAWSEMSSHFSSYSSSVPAPSEDLPPSYIQPEVKPEVRPEVQPEVQLEVKPEVQPEVQLPTAPHSLFPHCPICGSSFIVYCR
jgi:hypothetical protein